jgi:serine phosphatase RsbU (regulator of sigma subunit)/ligand-binding sensor domain-containing protein
LSHSTITCLFQDKKGFLWVGTPNGLNRFDGYSFKQYRENYFDSTTLTGFYIQKLAEDRGGNLWCTTNRGIGKLNRSSDSFQNYYLNSDSAHTVMATNIKDIVMDEERNQMFVLTDEYLFRMNIATGLVTKINTRDRIEFNRSDAVNRLTYNPDDDALYLYSKRLLYKYNISSDSIQCLIGESAGSFLKGENIQGIFCGIEGECWLYTNFHFWLLDENGFKEINLSHNGQQHPSYILFAYQKNPEEICFVTPDAIYSYSMQLSKLDVIIEYDLKLPVSDEITAFLSMGNSVFWLGTTEGLFKINRHKHIFSVTDISQYPVSMNNPVSMIYNDDGLLWLSSESGEVAVIDLEIQAGNRALKASLNLKKKIFSLKKGSSGNVICATEKGLYELKLDHDKILAYALFERNEVSAIDHGSSDTIWFSSGNRIYSIPLSARSDSFSIDMSNLRISPVIDLKHIGNSVFILQAHKVIKYSLHDSSAAIFSLKQLRPQLLPDNNCFLPADDKMLLVGTSSGAFIFYLYDFKVLPNYINAGQMAGPVHSMIQDESHRLWISSSRGLYSFDTSTNDIHTYDLSDGLPAQSFTDRMATISPKGKLCFFGDRKLVAFNPDSLISHKGNPNVLLTDVTLLGRNGQRFENLVGLDTLKIDTKYSQLLFHCALLDYWDPLNNTFKYSIQRSGETAEWIDISTNNSFFIAGLHTGDYILKIRGISHNLHGGEGSKSLVIRINAPIWRSRLAFILYAVILLALFYLILLFTTRQLRNLNRQYRERELIAKKVELQKEELTQKNKNITDSINYAKRIQMALMPSTKLFKKFFPDSFILHIPKDIVSGDFYWVNEVDGRVYFAAVDCTGHGVPGAFMSIIGFDLFRRITEIEKKKQPAEILNSLSQGFESIFRDIEDITLRDGMDAAFCAIDPNYKVLEFSGAFNPLYLVRDNTITEIKGDRFSVGLSHVEDALPSQEFRDHVIPLNEGDVIYIFTDGYADQFGGPEGKKYKYRRFRHLLLALHQLPMERQVEFLKRSIMDWKGDLDQVDDILILGIRIHHNK